jgi:hypothetical protein
MYATPEDYESHSYGNPIVEIEYTELQTPYGEGFGS